MVTFLFYLFDSFLDTTDSCLLADNFFRVTADWTITNRDFAGAHQVRTHKSAQPFAMRGTIIEGSLEVKLPTIWTDEKQSREEVERRERSEERRVEEKESEESRCRCAKR